MFQLVWKGIIQMGGVDRRKGHFKLRKPHHEYVSHKCNKYKPGPSATEMKIHAFTGLVNIPQLTVELILVWCSY